MARADRECAPDRLCDSVGGLAFAHRHRCFAGVHRYVLREINDLSRLHHITQRQSCVMRFTHTDAVVGDRHQGVTKILMADLFERRQKTGMNEILTLIAEA